MARILIIDDDVEFADHTATRLRKEGFEVVVSHTTEDALGTCSKTQPDLLILDVMFPDNPVAGFDVARQIRRSRAHRQLPIILLTGVNQEFPMDFSSRDIDPDWMPVQDFIEKPASIPNLARRIRKLLKKQD